MRVGGTPVPLPPGKPRSILGVLALAPGRPTPAARLVEVVWNEHPPRSARSLVHTYVSQLRQALARVAGAPAVTTSEGGYRLEVGPDAIDLHRLLGARDNTEGLATLVAGTAEELLPALDGAVIAGWRAQAAVARAHLEEDLWRRAVEAGDVSGGLPALETAVREDPLREEAVLILADAWRRLGRVDRALATLDLHRRALAVELGLDPSARVQLARQDLLAPVEVVEPAPPDPVATASVPPPDAGSPARTTRRLGVVAVALVLAVAGSVLLGIVVAGDGAPPALSGPGVLVVDPATGDVLETRALPVEPSEVLADTTTWWVRSEAGAAVAEVSSDDRSRELVTGLPEPPTSIAVADGAATVALGFSGTITSVSGGISAPPEPVAPGVSGRLVIAAGQAGLWAAGPDGRLHAPDGSTLDLPGNPRRLAVDGAAVWALLSSPAGLAVVRSGGGAPVLSTLRGVPADLTLDPSGGAWAVTTSEDRLWYAGEPGRVLATISLPGPPAAVAATDDRVWVALTDPARLLAVDPATLTVLTTVPLAGTPTDLAVTGERLLVAVR